MIDIITAIIIIAVTVVGFSAIALAAPKYMYIKRNEKIAKAWKAELEAAKANSVAK